MDNAEVWLRANDPDYDQTSEAWKHVSSDGEYRCPRQEVPWGSSSDVESLVESGEGRYFEGIEPRICVECYESFAPTTRWQRFCGEDCQQTARPPRDRTAYNREYMRVRRNGKRAA